MFSILVQVWTEWDPTLNLSVDRKSGLPESIGGDQLRRVSRLSRYGLDCALRLRGAQVKVFAIGEIHHPALQYSLAAGALVIDLQQSHMEASIRNFVEHPVGQVLFIDIHRVTSAPFAVGHEFELPLVLE